MKHQHGGTFRKMREKVNLSQAQVSKGLGYTSPQFISNIESGRVAPPIPILPALAFMYKVKTDQLKKVMTEIIHADVTRRMSQTKLTSKMRAKIASRI